MRLSQARTELPTTKDVLTWGVAGRWVRMQDGDAQWRYAGAGRDALSYLSLGSKAVKTKIDMHIHTDTHVFTKMTSF